MDRRQGDPPPPPPPAPPAAPAPPDAPAPAPPPPAGNDTVSTPGADAAFKTFYTPIIVLTAVFGAIFVLGPVLVRKGNHVGIIRCSIMLTAFSMWIFWVTVYISQMNPLMGPRLHNTSLAWIAHAWGNPLKGLTPETPEAPEAPEAPESPETPDTP